MRQKRPNESPTRGWARASRPQLERLEDRLVPAGVPWGDPSHLTISFAPNGTQIANHDSNLFAVLNSSFATAVWQKEILRAFQTWAVVANTNVAVVPDSGLPFGTPGKSQKDNRFGDIRIGAQSMSADVLAVTVPGDIGLAGTWTGDVLFNTLNHYTSKKFNLFSIALHEAGHALGVGESTDPKSVMFSSYQGLTALSAGDIAQMQAAYGTRVADSHEGSGGNDTINKAAKIQPPGSFKGATPLVAFGDITTNKDRDYYSFSVPPDYKGPATIRLQSSGISLLNPMVTVLDSKGKILGQAQSTSGFGDIVEVKLPRAIQGGKYTLLVQGASSDIFGVGHYGLAVSFDQRIKTTSTALTDVLMGDYQSLSPGDIDSLFQTTGTSLFNDDRHSDDTGVAAVKLTSKAGYPKNSRYEAIGSLSDAADADYYRIQAASVPKGQITVLTVTILALDGATSSGAAEAPRVSLLNEKLGTLNAKVLASGNGVYTIQASNVPASGNFYLKVSAPAGFKDVSKNYQLEAQFGTIPTQLTDFAAGTVKAAKPVNYNLYIGQTQLFQFLLSATASTPSGATVEAVIKDATGTILLDFTTVAGDTRSATALLLAPGAYSVQITAVGGGAAGVVFDLYGKPITDPIGPAISDPTLKPIYRSKVDPGTFIYPGVIVSPIPYLFFLLK